MDSYFKLPRNVYLLSLGQIIGMSATTLVFLLGGIIGAELAPSPTLATLPITLMVVGLAVFTIPAALLMKKIGRKKGFILSALVSLIIVLITAFAISQKNFILFCLSIFMLGTQSAFLQQYRFAAVESVSEKLAGKAVGLLLLAGILSGLIGPEIAKRTQYLFDLPIYTGSFLSLAILFGLAILLLTFFQETKLQQQKVTGKERPLKKIILQPLFLIAALSASIGYGVMVFIMTATPIQLHKISHFSLDQTAFVIQSHIIAMFLPSIFTGLLVQKFGPLKILLLGLIGFLLTVYVSISSDIFYSYWIALVLLGISWNFLFISSTVLLPQTYTSSERFKTQGINDFIVVLTQMLVSFSAGSILLTTGWVNLNLLTLPFILITFVIFLLLRTHLNIKK